MKMQSAPDTRRWLRTGAAPPPGLRQNTAASPPQPFLGSHHRVLRGSIYLQEVTDDRRDGRFEVTFVSTELPASVLEITGVSTTQSAARACRGRQHGRVRVSSRGVGSASCARDSTRSGLFFCGDWRRGRCETNSF